jgi:hypothetical protein
MLTRYKSFKAEAEVCGQVREISWEGGVLSVHGLTSFVEMSEVLKSMATGTVERFVMRDVGQPAPVVPTPPPPKAAPPKLGLGGATSVLNDLTPEPPPAPVAPVEVALVEAAPVDSDDLSAFGRMTRLGEIVDEVVRRGEGKDFTGMFAYLIKLKDSMLCPTLEKIEQTEGGPDGFEDRVRRHAKSKNIPGAL